MAVTVILGDVHIAYITVVREREIGTVSYGANNDNAGSDRPLWPLRSLHPLGAGITLCSLWSLRPRWPLKSLGTLRPLWSNWSLTAGNSHGISL